MHHYRKCVLDMDGVFVDFHRGVRELFGISQSAYDALPRPLGWTWVWDLTGLTEEEFWKRLSAEWWEHLPWTPEGKEIVAILESYFGPENICIGSDHSGRAFVVDGKQRWIQRELPRYFPSNVMFGKPKHFMAGSIRKLLVDDGNHNCDNFQDEEGHVHLFSRPWNRNHHVPDPLQHLKEFLRAADDAHGRGLPRRAVGS